MVQRDLRRRGHRTGDAGNRLDITLAMLYAITLPRSRRPASSWPRCGMTAGSWQLTSSGETS
jgi:hypothetical protein